MKKSLVSGQSIYGFWSKLSFMVFVFLVSSCCPFLFLSFLYIFYGGDVLFKRLFCRLLSFFLLVLMVSSLFVSFVYASERSERGGLEFSLRDLVFCGFSRSEIVSILGLFGVLVVCIIILVV